MTLFKWPSNVDVDRRLVRFAFISSLLVVYANYSTGHYGTVCSKRQEANTCRLQTIKWGSDP